MTTDSATTVTNSSAILYGNVTSLADNDEVTAGLRYGQHPDYMTFKTEGSVSDTGSYNAELTGISPNTTYFFQAYAATATDTAWTADTLTFTTLTNPCSVTVIRNNESGTGTRIDSVKDHENNWYKVVQIGNQCWMAENMRATKNPNGTDISSGIWAPGRNSVATYGRLYDWAAVMNGAASSTSNPSGVQGICPDGWHVPSDAEWKQMEMEVGMSQSDADNTGRRGNIAAKLSGNTGWILWDDPNAAGNFYAPDRNSSGFSALPAGTHTNSYSSFGYGAYFWSATQHDIINAYGRSLSCYDAGMARFNTTMAYGYSVRCVRD